MSNIFSDMLRPEVGGRRRVGVVKPLVYRQLKLHHVALVNWVKAATASIPRTHCPSFHETLNVQSENMRGGNSTIISFFYICFIYKYL